MFVKTTASCAEFPTVTDPNESEDVEMEREPAAAAVLELFPETVTPHPARARLKVMENRICRKRKR